MDPVYSEELTFEIIIRDECPNDEVTPIGDVPDILYYIDKDSTVPIEPQWHQAKERCPKGYFIYQLINGVETPLTAAMAGVFVFYPSNGHLDLSTNDSALDG